MPASPGHRRAGLLHDDQPAAPRARQHPAVHLQQRPAQPVCGAPAALDGLRQGPVGGRRLPGLEAVAEIDAQAEPAALKPAPLRRERTLFDARRRVGSAVSVQRQQLQAKAAPMRLALHDRIAQRGTPVARAPGGVGRHRRGNSSARTPSRLANQKCKDAASPCSSSRGRVTGSRPVVARRAHVQVGAARRQRGAQRLPVGPELAAGLEFAAVRAAPASRPRPRPCAALPPRRRRLEAARRQRRLEGPVGPPQQPGFVLLPQPALQGLAAQQHRRALQRRRRRAQAARLLDAAHPQLEIAALLGALELRRARSWRVPPPRSRRHRPGRAAAAAH